MMSLPLISIITVVYNSKEMLEQSILSVLKQSYKNIEHIVVDGGSNDGTLNIINSYNDSITKWVSEKDKGIYDAMNKGIKLAKGEYIGFLNAGDLYCYKNTLSELFSNIPSSIDIIYGDMILSNGHKNRKKYHKATEFTKENLINKGTGVLCHQSLFVKRTNAPMFNTRYKIKAELNWYFDLLKTNKKLSYIHKPIPVVYYDANGYAFQNFWLNNWELVKVIYRQFGLNTLIKYNYFKKISMKYKWWKDARVSK